MVRKEKCGRRARTVKNPKNTVWRIALFLLTVICGLLMADRGENEFPVFACSEALSLVELAFAVASVSFDGFVYYVPAFNATFVSAHDSMNMAFQSLFQDFG